MSDSITISTDKSLLDLGLIHGFLKNSYWAKEIPLEIVQKSIENSLCFGLYEDQKQIGFARLITDYVTFAYLGDVFIVEQKQGRGLGKMLLEHIMQHPELARLRRLHLVTLDAQEFYTGHGFECVKNPEMHMEISRPKIYQSL